MAKIYDIYVRKDLNVTLSEAQTIKRQENHYW